MPSPQTEHLASKHEALEEIKQKASQLGVELSDEQAREALDRSLAALDEFFLNGDA